MGAVKRKIPHEIKEYQSSMFFGFTVRQVICSGVAILLVAPTIMLNMSLLHLPTDTLGYVIMIEVIPCAACGWFSYNGMPIEQMFLKILEYYFTARRKKWQWKSDEVRLFEAVQQIELEELTKERNDELNAEKIRIAEEKKHRKSVRTEKKRTKRMEKKNA